MSTAMLHNAMGSIGFRLESMTSSLLGGAGRDLQQSRIPPERQGGEDVEAVPTQIGFAFDEIELKRGALQG